MNFRIPTVSEYEKYKFNIPNPSRPFWLDPCGLPGDGLFPVVGDDGILKKFREHPDNPSVYLRPLVEFDRAGEKHLFKPYEKVDFLGYRWTAVTQDAILCDSCLGETQFNDKPCLFKDSYLRYRLCQFMNERLDNMGHPDYVVGINSEKKAKKEAKKELLDDKSAIISLYNKCTVRTPGERAGLYFGFALLTLSILAFGIMCALGEPGLMLLCLASLFFGGFLLICSEHSRHKRGKAEFINNIESSIALDAQANRLKLPTVSDSDFTETTSYGFSEEYDENSFSEVVSEIKDKAVNKLAGITGIKKAGIREAFRTESISDEKLKQKFSDINRLINGIRSVGNRSVNAKLDSFFIPETQKLYSIATGSANDGIDSPNKTKYTDMLNENLDKTVQLLTLEYDRVHEAEITDMNIRLGTMNLMLGQSTSDISVPDSKTDSAAQSFTNADKS